MPPLHPDPARQTMLLEHLQSLFEGPVLIASKKTALHVQALIPGFSTLVYDDLPTADSSEDAASIFPAHRPHPEDPVCLMLTSGALLPILVTLFPIPAELTDMTGSTGQPKAVVLRHTQLLSSCRGKAARHLTSHQSRFLNWIAFDHVACLSEIHIHALLANAQ